MGKAIMSGAPGGAADGTYGSFIGRRESATETVVQFYCSEAATFSYMQGFIEAGSGSGTNTMTFRNNAASQSLVASRSSSGHLSDTTNTVTVAATDKIDFLISDTGTNANYQMASVVVSFSSGHGCFHGSGDGTPQIFDVASSTRYAPINGSLEADGTTTETDAQTKNRAYTSWESMAVNVTANARVNTSTLRNRINAANGTGSISIGAGVTGFLTDTTIGDALASGDLINVSLQLGTGVEDLTISSFQATLKNSSLPKCDIVRREAAGTARAASATDSYYLYAGDSNVSTSPYTFNTPYTLTFSNPRIYLSANTYTANGTYSLYVDGSDRINVTLTAATTGWFEDTSSTYVSAANVGFAAKIVNGTSGSITIREMTVTAQERYEVTANTGSYAVTGSDATLVYGRKLIADTGSYAVTGSAANLLYTRKFSAETGSYVVTGSSANLLYGRKFSAESGSYAITGSDANLLYGRNLSAVTGSYAITGFSATLTVTAAGAYVINAESGAYAITGSAANLLATRSLLAGSGAYAITGFDATLTQGGVTPVIIEDTHDGDKVRKRFAKERRERDRRKKQIIEAYEYLVEGKVPAAKAIVEEFIEPEEKTGTVAIQQQYINFDRLLNDLDAVERLWQLYLAMDDEDVLALL